jgi:phospho-N-acetylmuramoyl-pentapeptide-transferase
MFYLLYQQFAEYRDVIPGFNLLGFQTVRTGLAIATAMIVAVAMGSRFIRWMRAKQGKGQPIREDGPESHLSKKGTPTMGGFMILAGVVVATLLWGDLSNIYVWVGADGDRSYGALGFIDDYAKVTKQTSAGLKGSQKLVAQFVIAPRHRHLPDDALRPFAARRAGPEHFRGLPAVAPMAGGIRLVLPGVRRGHDRGLLNAVNLTDGLDGLAIVPVMMRRPPSA